MVEQQFCWVRCAHVGIPYSVSFYCNDLSFGSTPVLSSTHVLFCAGVRGGIYKLVMLQQPCKAKAQKEPPSIDAGPERVHVEDMHMVCMFAMRPHATLTG